MSAENNKEFYKQSIERLSKKEVSDVLKEVQDARVRDDEDIEHFTIHKGERTIYIPKRKLVVVQNENVPITEYIKKRLHELDSEIE